MSVTSNGKYSINYACLLYECVILSMSDELYTVEWLNEDYSEHFEGLYKFMYKRLYLFARNFLMDEALADDVVQEVFMGLWNKGKSMPENIPLERYLFTSVRNLCVDHHRKLNIIDKYQKQTFGGVTRYATASVGIECRRRVEVQRSGGTFEYSGGNRTHAYKKSI